MLGEAWQKVQEIWLHRLGNITLSGYNSKYSDEPFLEKKTMANGFNDSPLRLNKFIREQVSWTDKEMEIRRKELAGRALHVWPPLIVDAESVKAAELEERKSQAAKYNLEQLEFDPESRELFASLREQILALGSDIAELSGEYTVTYRVYDFFVEIIPRKRKLSLVLNLDFEECDDPTQRAHDATEYAFIARASESGGVLFSVKDKSHVGPAMHLIRQAYERVSE